MPSNSPSRHSTVAVFSASVLAAATVSGYVAYFNGNTYQAGTSEVTTASGSTVTAGGGRFQATNLADAACLKDDNGRYYNCYQEDVFTSGTGGCVAGGCGTHSFNVAHITKPYSGSGVVKRMEITCDRSAVSTNAVVGQVSGLTASGNDIMTRRLVGSGALHVRSTGSHLWAEATPYLKVSTSASVGTSECLLSVWSDEMYNP